jgi:ferredoxin
MFRAYDARMRVAVDIELCQGHNRCCALAPEVLDVDDYGTAVVIGDGIVPVDIESRVRLAVSNCPEFAITMVDDDVDEQTLAGDVSSQAAE